MQIGHTANEFESVTKATIGQGAIVTSDTSTGQNSLAGVNRDPFNTEIIIKDQQTAGLSVDANIDARVFTEAGRDELIDEQKELLDNIETIGSNVEDAIALGYETSENVYNTLLIFKKIEEVRATLTPEEQVIFDNELRKLQTDESLKSNVAPVAIGAGVAIGGAEIAAAGAAGGVYICSKVDVCSETVANGLDNAYDNAKAGSQAVQDYAVGIFSKKSGSNKKAKVLPASSNVASTPPDPDEEGGVRLTGGGKKTLGNLTNLKDKTVADAIRSRGGTGSNVNKVASHLRNEKVGEIANRAARGDADAATALKIIKDAKRLAQKR